MIEYFGTKNNVGAFMRFFSENKRSAVQLIGKCIRFKIHVSKKFVKTKNTRSTYTSSSKAGLCTFELCCA